MIQQIKKFIIAFVKEEPVTGCLMFSGSFSRNEVSFVNDVIVSDMELLFIYDDIKNAIKLKTKLKTLSQKLCSRK